MKLTTLLLLTLFSASGMFAQKVKVTSFGIHHTPVAPTPDCNTSPVPEPSSYVMLGGGLTALAVFKRREALKAG